MKLFGKYLKIPPWSCKGPILRLDICAKMWSCQKNWASTTFASSWAKQFNWMSDNYISRWDSPLVTFSATLMCISRTKQECRMKKMAMSKKRQIRRMWFSRSLRNTYLPICSDIRRIKCCTLLLNVSMIAQWESRWLTIRKMHRTWQWLQSTARKVKWAWI